MSIRLPTYPSLRARRSLSPSQLATLHQLISSLLQQCLDVPIAKCDISSILAFLSSYAQDTASRVLQDLIWANDNFVLSPVEKAIKHRVFSLAQRTAAFSDFQILLDFAVAYGKKNPQTIRNLFTAAFSQNQSGLTSQLTDEVAPAFTALLGSTDQGLYGVRKISHIILACLRPSPPEIRRIFARDKAFLLALAAAYDQGLSTVTQSYGGLRLTDETDREADDWERILLETKVALMDSFHILLRVLFDDIAAVPEAGSALASQCEPAFEIVFALLELPQPQPPPGSSAIPLSPTPFLNQSLLADYQHSYDLSRTVASVLRKADDARTQVLESALRSLDAAPNDGNPGALKLIIKSSGVPPGIDYRGHGTQTASKGKEKANAPPLLKADPVLDAAVAQVLDILPDQPPHYVRYLLGHSDYPFKGSAERLIEALFEGTAPPLDHVEASIRAAEAAEFEHTPQPVLSQDDYEFTKERRNVFDGVAMEPTLLRVGKKSDPATIQDRAYIEQMKADILRRAEEASYEDDEDEDESNKEGGRDLAFEDDLDAESRVKVRDGEASDDEEGEEAAEKPPAAPETILELAYIRDPSLFDRDAQTRRSKGRDELRIQTGWADEQIEGWKIMLEKNPNKSRILQKHEFTGNKPLSHEEMQAEASSAWKDRNKAKNANHNRKAGHDKKMARGGGPS
ncbi:hypothetical protein EIP91_002063 [Steccherinum ochraceum]|uniref:CUE domain-containing protein n=1 Tax=Steccherinum ochraceum TaxID=92696 RepID=A0A4R0S0U3_9APHY|nr:hypothetical protein EIP91_002063 [Steccherinum ochraceum]